MFGLGIALGMLASDLWNQLAYTTDGTKTYTVTKYHTILTRGVNIRGRIRGRLYALDVWREHGN